jgi:hypothetical protein
MVSEALVNTGLVVTVNVAVIALAGTVTLAGTWAAEVLLLERLTTAPPLGAGLLSVTVAVDDVAPRTVVGFSVREVRVAAGVIVIFEDTVLPPYVADIATIVVEVTTLVFTVNVAVVEPCGTVTVEEESDVVVVSLVVSDICAPPAGAGPFRLTVPVEELPPAVVEGFTVTEATLTPDVAP